MRLDFFCGSQYQAQTNAHARQGLNAIVPIVAVEQFAFVWADAGIDAVGYFNHGGLRLAGHRDANGQAAVLVFAGIADEVF